MNGIEHWLTGPVTEGIARLTSKSLAVDVGANLGTWSTPLCELFDQVLAFEPDERNFSQLPSIGNLTSVKAAVADITGTTPFYIRASSGHNSLLEVHPIGGDGMAPVPVVEEVQVPCLTLDDACEDGADFVKIDIEGGEVLALRGCVDAGRWSRTLFVVECHDTFNDVEAELYRLGKRVTRIPHPLVAHPGHCWAIGE
jgi:FkbM family methyltransferase